MDDTQRWLDWAAEIEADRAYRRHRHAKESLITWSLVGLGLLAWLGLALMPLVHP